MEIEANEDFLLFKGEGDERENNNIKIHVHNMTTIEIEKEYVYIQFEKPFIYNKERYIFAPKTDYYLENIQNECFLYNLFYWENIDSNIFILDFPDLTQVLKKKKFKEYIVTVVLLYEPNYYSSLEKKRIYFYNSTIIKVSQKLLDKDYSTPMTVEDIFLIIFEILGGLILICLLLLLIIYIILCCIKKTASPLNSINLEKAGIIN